MSDADPVWRPDPSRVADTHVHAFARQYFPLPDMSSKSMAELQRWSVEQPQHFWPAVVEYAGVEFATPYSLVVSDPVAMPGARWFEGATFNYAEQLLRQADDTLALIVADETGRERTVSRQELAQQTAAIAAGMREAGIRPGDRVAAVLPNCPETVAVMLAAASVGAVFSSCSPEFGERAIRDRLGQIRPKLLFACDGYTYGGRPHETLSAATRLRAKLDSVEALVVVPFLDRDGAFHSVPGVQTLDEFARPGAEPRYEPLPFDHPLLILYSSGTTGKPKCIVHRAGGTLLQHLKEHLLHVDLHPGDVLFYFTTCGWMMWNWLVGALAARATLLLYDGSPFHPTANVLPGLAARHGVRVFGTSPRYLTALEKNGVEFSRWQQLDAVLSTGAPLAPSSYDFVQRAFGDIRVSSISGGTDIVSCFVLGSPVLPVYRGEIQCAGLGMAVDVFNEAGQSVEAEPGELVCTRAFPSMPLGFWDDPNGERFRAAYFARFPGVWTHGDRVERTQRGGYIISGRSDATLNPGGVRMGSAEIVEPALQIAEVVDALAVGYPVDGDEAVALFVVLAAGVSLDDGLRRQIADQIRKTTSPRHVPDLIKDVTEIPRTLSGKPVELAVRAVLAGEEPGNLDAIANPAALKHFRVEP